MALMKKLRSDDVHKIGITLYGADDKVLIARAYGGHWIETLLRDLTLIKMMFIPVEREPKREVQQWPK